MGRRVPVMFQMSTVECGAACLAMVLRFHGHHASVREARAVCQSGRDGVTAGEIARAGRLLGLQARGFALSDVSLAAVPLPAILHWEGNHFVVLERWTPSHATVVDPARGRRRMPVEEFRRRAGGVVLEVQPASDFVRRRRPRGAMWAHLRPLVNAPGAGVLLAQVVGASFLLQVLGLAVPVAIKVVLDTVLVLEERRLVALLVAGGAVLVTAQFLNSYLRSSLLVRLQGRVDGHALMHFLVHLLKLPTLYFHHRTTGDVLMRAGSLAMLRELLANQTLTSVTDVLLALGYLAALLWVSPSMGAVVGAFAALAVVLLLATTRRMQDSMAGELTAQAETHGQVVETLGGILTVKAMASEGRVIDHLDMLVQDWMQAAIRRSHLAAVIDAVSSTVRVAGPVAVLLLGTAAVRADEMTIGTMVAAIWLGTAILGQVYALSSNGQRLQLAGAQLVRIVDVLEAEPEDERPQAPRTSLRGEIEAREVTFAYQERGAPVIADVSLHVPAGSRVALVGSTGAGKSTLGLLLLGMFPLRSGEVLYDGVPMQELHQPSLRAQFGVVLQDPWVFRGTIRENLTLGDTGFPVHELRWALRTADLLEDVQALPMGPETSIGERGTGLSGGQQQRLAIARAVLRRPSVLLLDEATSHLDVITEERIWQRLQELECTQIVIAHRLSTVRDADLIVVLDRGRVVETGRHDGLVKKGGAYAALVRRQLEGQSVGSSRKET